MFFAGAMAIAVAAAAADMLPRSASRWLEGKLVVVIADKLLGMELCMAFKLESELRTALWLTAVVVGALLVAAAAAAPVKVLYGTERGDMPAGETVTVAPVAEGEGIVVNNGMPLGLEASGFIVANVTSAPASPASWMKRLATTGSRRGNRRNAIPAKLNTTRRKKYSYAKTKMRLPTGLGEQFRDRLSLFFSPEHSHLLFRQAPLAYIA